MDAIVCPHCRKPSLPAPDVPQDVVVVMPCPHCHELAVLFRDRVIPLSRRIIEQGTFDERKTHLAEVIAHFLEAGLLEGEAGEQAQPQRKRRRPKRQRQAEPEPFIADEVPGITDEEIDRFVRIELKCIDNPTYFRRHFG